jgi:hypothetical protein
MTTDHELIWLSQREKVLEREHHMIQSKKFMLMMVWNPCRFHRISVLEKGRKFNVIHHVTEIFLPLSEWRASDAPESDRMLIMHADIARPHTASSQLNSLKISGCKRPTSSMFTRYRSI